jgi:FSR family fosmidomycin resistance protein-like MFS transporter
MTDAILSRNDLRTDGTVMGLVGAAHFLSHFYQIALPAVFVLLHDDLGADFTLLGFVMTVFYAASGIGQAFAGILVDRFGAKRLLLIGLALLAAAIGLCGLVPGYVYLLPLAMLAGLGNSVFHPADLAILSLKVSTPRLGRAYGVHALSGTLGYAAAPPIAVAIAAVTDWRTALIAIGALGLAAVALLWASGDNLSTPQGRRRPYAAGIAPISTGYRQLLATPAIMVAFGYFAITAMAGIGLQTFADEAAIEIYAVPLEVAVQIVSAYLVCSAAGILIGGFVADAFRRHDVVTTVGLTLAAVFLIAAGADPLGYAGLVTLVAIGGFCAGVTAPSRDLIVRGVVPPGATGKVFGFVYSGLDLGSALAPTLFGWLIDHRWPHVVFLIAASLFAAGAAVMLIVAARPAPARA